MARTMPRAPFISPRGTVYTPQIRFLGKHHACSHAQMCGLPHLPEVVSALAIAASIVVTGLAPDNYTCGAGRAWLAVQRCPAGELLPVDLAGSGVLGHQNDGLPGQGFTSFPRACVVRIQRVHLMCFQSS